MMKHSKTENISVHQMSPHTNQGGKNVLCGCAVLMYNVGHKNCTLLNGTITLQKYAIL